MTTTRELYRQAHSMARLQGANHAPFSSARMEIQHNLYRKFGVKLGATVMVSYRPCRTFETTKYLFAIMGWSHRAEDHYRQLQREYGRESIPAESALNVWRFWEELYWTESEKANGALSVDESAKIVRMWQQAQDNANWRKQYGSSWKYTKQLAHTQIIALAKRSLGVK